MPEPGFAQAYHWIVVICECQNVNNKIALWSIAASGSQSIMLGLMENISSEYCFFYLQRTLVSFPLSYRDWIQVYNFYV